MRISSIASVLLLALVAAGASACRSEKATEPDPLPSGTTVIENTVSGTARYLASDTLGVYCSMTMSFAWDSTRTGAAGEQLRFGNASGDVRRLHVRPSALLELGAHRITNAPARARVFGVDSIELTLWSESAAPAFAAPLRTIKGTRTPDGFWKGDWSCAPTGRVAAPADIAGLAVGTWQTLVITVR